MDYSLILFSVVILYSGYKGYKSGVWKILARVVSLLVAYTVAFLLTQSFGQVLQSSSSLEGLMAYLVAGLILFTSTSALLMLIFGRIIRATNSPKAPVSNWQSISGGVLGVLFGVVTGFFLVWFSLTLQTIYQTKRGLPLAHPTAFQQTTKKLASTAIKKIVNGVTDQKDVAAVSATLLADPARTLERFKNLNKKDLIRQFFADPTVQSALNSNNAKTVLQHSAFKRLVRDKDFIALSRQLEFSEKPEEMEKQFAIKVTTFWAQINQVRSNPEYIRITNLPEIRNMITSGNYYSMFNNKKIETLLNIIYSAKKPKIAFSDIEGSEALPKPLEKKPVIHRWVDEDGKVHYSDKKH